MKYIKEGMNVWLVFPGETPEEAMSEYAPHVLSDDEQLFEDGLHDITDDQLIALVEEGIVSVE